MKLRLVAYAVFAVFLLSLVSSAKSYWQSVPQISIAASYTGPGDIVTSATAWYGLRAYNAAYATGSNKSINVRRASDNATSDIVILSSGALDIASANTFATTDATCTGTIASTTLSCVSASSTPHVGSTLTGAGITQPSYITACGTFTAGTGTCTLNAAQTVSVGETITMQYGLYVTKIYDQSGGGNCSGACDIAQATAGNQPQLLPVCVGALPCIDFSTTSIFFFVTQTLSSTTIVSMSIVGRRYSIRGGFPQTLFSTVNAGNQEEVGFTASANTVYVFSGSNVTATAADASFHAFQMVAGTSAVANVDGTETTGNSGANAATTRINIGASGTNGNPCTGCYFGEAGAWTATFSSGNRSSMCHNQFTYWGTAASC